MTRAEPPSSEPLRATFPADPAGLVGLLLLACLPFTLWGLIGEMRGGSPVSIGPHLVAPIAGLGLLRERRWAWPLALGVLWAFLLYGGFLLVRVAQGAPMHLRVLGIPIAERPTVLVPAIAALLLLMFGLHWLLMRPAVLRVFRPPEATPWGASASLLLAGLAVGLGQIAGSGVAVWLSDLPTSELMDATRLLANGIFLTHASLGSAPVAIGLVVFAAWLRNGPTVFDYLGLRGVAPSLLTLGVAATLALTTLEHAGNAWLDRPIPAFVTNVVRSAGDSPLLWLAFVVVAPCAEEAVFRGFLLPGLTAAWRTGPAVLATAITFASLHLGQYGLWEIAGLVLFGVLLALGRVLSGSLYVPIAMHMTMNLVALLGTAAHLRGGP